MMRPISLPPSDFLPFLCLSLQVLVKGSLKKPK